MCGSLSLSYFAIMVPRPEASVAVLSPERETRVQVALLIALVAVMLVAWILRPESAPDRRAAGPDEESFRSRRIRRR
jgi:hypothetical protein